MVGGVIIGLTRGPGGIHVNAAECPHYPSHGRGDDCPRPATCCVYTDGRLEDRTLADLQIGDSFWWQGGYCYWTPKANRKPEGSGQKCGVDYDIRLRKIGYSH